MFRHKHSDTPNTLHQECNAYSSAFGRVQHTETETQHSDMYTINHIPHTPPHLLQGLGHLLHGKGGHEAEGAHGKGNQGGYRTIAQDAAGPQHSAVPS